MGHILALPDNSRLKDIFCKTCNKLYNIKLDITPMIKFGRQLYEYYSNEGQAIKQKISKAKNNARQAKMKWIKEHPDYYKEYRANNPGYRAREAARKKRRLIDNPQAQIKLQQSRRRYLNKPEVKKRRARLERIRRSFVRQGLLPDSVKKYRLRKKLKSLNLIPDSPRATQIEVISK